MQSFSASVHLHISTSKKKEEEEATLHDNDDDDSNIRLQFDVCHRAIGIQDRRGAIHEDCIAITLNSSLVVTGLEMGVASLLLTLGITLELTLDGSERLRSLSCSSLEDDMKIRVRTSAGVCFAAALMWCE